MIDHPGCQRVSLTGADLKNQTATWHQMRRCLTYQQTHQIKAVSSPIECQYRFTPHFRSQSSDIKGGNIW
jgi:hypothetical protein